METNADLVRCSICKELFSDPRMLPCIHNFCLRCLQQTASQTNKGPGERMPCHCCGREFTVPPGGLADIQRNFFIEDLVEAVKAAVDKGTQCDLCIAKGGGEDQCIAQATMHCNECRQNLCRTCSEHHRKQKVLKKHHLTKLDLNREEQASSSGYCSLHNRHQLSIYCFECNLIVCDECCKQNHEMHTCKTIKEAIEISRKQITADLETVGSYSKAGSAKEEQLLKIKTECMKDFIAVEAEVIERGRKLKEMVDAHVGCLVSQLVLMKTKRLYEIDCQIDKIKTCLGLADSFEKSCKDLSLETSSDENICSEATGLHLKAVKLQRLYEASHLEDPFSTTVILDISQTEERLLKMRNVVGEIREQLKPMARNTEVSTKALALASHETKSKIFETDLKPATTHIEKRRRKDEVPEKKVAILKHTVFDPTGIRLSAKLVLDANVWGVTKLSDYIYVLVRSPNAIHVFPEQSSFRSKTQIQIDDIKKPHDIAAAVKQRCLYVTDSESKCVWKIMSDYTITKWLPNIGEPYTLFMTYDSRLVMARQGKQSTIEVYKQDASLDCLVQLPNNIEEPLHVVENSGRNFVVSHKWRECGARETVWSISVLSNRGEILHRFCAKDSVQHLKEPQYLSVDSVDQVLVADFGNGRVLLLNSDLNWNQSLKTEDQEATMFPKKLHLDRDKRQLLVGQYLKKGVHVYTF